MDVNEVEGMKNKKGLSISIEIENMFNMARINNIRIYVVNEILQKEYRGRKMDKTSKYAILKNGV